MTVPGRNGLNYDVNLQYVSGNGVPAQESASWVGLGWNLSQYQITCNPNYRIGANQITSGEPIAYTNSIGNNTQDLYYLSYPGGSTQIRKFSDGKWYPLKWSAIKIDAVADSVMDSNNKVIFRDYKSFIVTDINGTRYIYSARLLKNTDKVLVNHCPKPCSDATHPFYYAFKLTAILSPDYVDAGNNSLIPNDYFVGGKIVPDKGSWIRLDYTPDTTIENMPGINTSHISMQVNLLKSITTPTHIAEFNLKDDYDNIFIYNGREVSAEQSLSNIALFTTNKDTLKTIWFHMTPAFNWTKTQIVGNPSSFSFETENLRLRLDDVEIKGKNNLSIPSYKFTYYDNPNPNSADYYNQTYFGPDPWGLFTGQRLITFPDSNKVAWTAWMLKTITYPTGAREEFEYESDRYQTSIYSARAGSSAKKVIAGGLRLKSRKIIDPLTNKESLYQYRYALTNNLNPGYGFLNCEPQNSFNNIYNNDVVQDYEMEVHYPDVQIINPDSTMIRRYYTCAYSNTATNDPFLNGVPYNYNYSCYQNSYKNVTTLPDPYLDNLTKLIPAGDLHANWHFYDLNGSEITDDVMYSNLNIYKKEIKEFDDEPLVFSLTNGDTSAVWVVSKYVTFRLFNNGWKRGLLTREENYPGPKDPVLIPSGKIWDHPIESKDYFYTLKPIKTESYEIIIGDPYAALSSANNFYTCMTSSGWPRLDKIVTQKNYGINYTTEEYAYNEENGLIEKELKNSLSDSARVTYNKYAYRSYQSLAGRHMLSQKEYTAIGTKNSIFSDILTANKKIESLTRQTWSNSLSADTNQWYEENTYQWLDKNNNTNYDTGEEICTQSNISYDVYGNITESRDANGVSFATKWGFNYSLPVAGTLNASLKEVSSLDLEDGTKNGWTSNLGDSTITGIAHTGQKGLYFASGIYRYWAKRFKASELNLAGKYFFSGWVKTSGIHPKLLWYVSFTDGITYEYPQDIKAAGTGNWQYLELTIDLASAAARHPGKIIDYIEVYIINGDQTNNDECSWDDVRFYPVGSQLLTDIFDPSNYQLTSQLDANSIPVFYEYDGLQRLTVTRDYSGRKLSANTYFYSRNSIGSDIFDVLNPNFIMQSRYFDANNAQILKTYSDGLGRNVQSQIQIGNDDIISHTTYDLMGRKWQSYKPYQYNSGHNYDPNFYTHDTSYYNSKVYNGSAGVIRDAYPYSSTEYLYDGRPRYVRPEGSEWNKSHFLEYKYNITSLSGYSGNLEQKTIYNENDSHDDQSQYRDMKYEYYDALGNLSETVEDPLGLNLITKLKYNVLGKLTKSAPPKGENYSTSYIYNSLGQLIKKTSPDAGTVQYLYDRNGNVRLVKDANHSSGTLNNVNISNFIGTGATYNDSLTINGRGKLTVTINPGSYTFSGTVTVQIKKNNAVIYTLSASSSPSTLGTITLPSGRYGYTVQSTARTPQGYTSVNYRLQCLKNYAFVYNKYDRLNRLTETGEYETDSLTTSFSQANAENPNYPSASNLILKQYFYDVASTNSIAAGQRNLKGKLSWSVSNCPGSANNVYENNTTFYSYDEMGRIEWTIQLDMGWYQKKLSYTYDLLGNVINKGYYDYDWRSGPFYTSYIYDQAGRLTTVNTSPNSDMSGATQEASYQYFASGKQKRLQLAQAQGVDYRYNERDWLTMINHQNLNSSQDPGGDGANGVPVDKFGMIIDYNRLNDIGTAQNALAQWNGNISWVMYNMSGASTLGTSLVGYTYSYDKANRLLGADFGKYSSKWDTTSMYDERNYIYDGNGNIKSLKRYGKNASLMDSLDYSYDTNNNRLKFVYDKVSDISYSSDLDNQLPGNYTYDGNGNALCDVKNGIGFILYNIDNLPIYVYKTDGSYSFNAYDVSGTRVRKLLSSGTDNYYVNSPKGQTEVVDLAPYGYSYTYNIWGNDNIGQVRANNGAFSRFYYLKDHLGNIRVTVNGSGAVDGFNDYYPFGGVMDGRSQAGTSDRRYRFTGKERDDETGLDYFGARYYDSRIGRWLSVDPKSDKYIAWSPYNYCKDNALIFIDPDGRGIKPDKETQKLINEHKQNKKEFANAKGIVNKVWAGLKTLWTGLKLESKTWTVIPEVTIIDVTAGKSAGNTLLNDAAWHKDAPKNIEPGKQELYSEHYKYNPRTGELEKSTVQYDQYGRQVSRTDYTDHGYVNHTNPHSHETIYNQQYPNGVEKNVSTKGE